MKAGLNTLIASLKEYWGEIGLPVKAFLALGAFVTVLRFTMGLATVTNLSDNNPWGIWIGFDLLCGVALAAGGYTTSAACYIFGMKKYHGAVRPAILTAFLGYAMVVFALHYDLGHPLRLIYPFAVSSGPTSVLFEVGACVATYLTVLFLEFSIAPMEWLGYKTVRSTIHYMTLALTIFGVVLSTLHQSSLGALFLLAPGKLHPLWWSPYLPVFFFVSSIFAGMSMVIVEGTLSHRYFHDKMDDDHLGASSAIITGFAKAASFVMAAYLALKVIGLAYGDTWHYLGTGWGLWFLFELLGFVAAPCVMYAIGAREKNTTLIRWAALLGVLGIVLNRLNVSLIAFNWQLPSAERYFPSIFEIIVSAFVITIGVLIFRFVVTRMPIFYEHPDYKEAH